MVNLMVGAYYDQAVSQPISMAFVGATNGVSPLLNVVTMRAPAFGVQAFS